MRRQRDLRIPEVLVTALRDHAWESPSPGLRALLNGHDLRGLAEAAAFHRIEGYVALSLRQLPEHVTPDVNALLSGLYYRARAGHLRAVHELGRLAPVLDASAGRWLVVKGPVLSEVIHPEPGLRSYSDLDLVVPAARFAATVEACEREGSTLIEEDWWPRGPGDLSGEIYLRTASGLIVDLHWHLVNYAQEREAFTVPMDELFTRARTVAIGGRPVPTLDDIDTLLHLALHASISGGNRLVWLKDIEQSIARTAPDWHTVVERARCWGTALVTATMLAKVRRVLGVQVPEDVLRALAPGRTWERLSAFAGSLTPPQAAAESGSLDRMVSRATRSDLASSGRELLVHWLAWAASHLRRRPPRRSSQTPGGRAAFFAALSRAAGVDDR